MRTITERHYVIAGVIWLDHAPIASVELVRCAADPEATWVTLRPGRDYQIVDAAGGHLYVSALVGTLIEVTYTVGGRPHAGPACDDSSESGAVNTRPGEHRHPLVTGGGNEHDVRDLSPVPGIGALVSVCSGPAGPIVNEARSW